MPAGTVKSRGRAALDQLAVALAIAWRPSAGSGSASWPAGRAPAGAAPGVGAALRPVRAGCDRRAATGCTRLATSSACVRCEPPGRGAVGRAGRARRCGRAGAGRRAGTSRGRRSAGSTRPRPRTCSTSCSTARSTESVILDVVLPVLRAVGERSDPGDQEIATRALRVEPDRRPAARPGARLGSRHRAAGMLACPSGERHDLGLVAFGLALREQGWRITLLGHDTPTGTIERAAGTLAPRAVVLAAAVPERFADPARQPRCRPAARHRRRRRAGGGGRRPRRAAAAGRPVLGGRAGGGGRRRVKARPVPDGAVHHAERHRQARQVVGGERHGVVPNPLRSARKPTATRPLSGLLADGARGLRRVAPSSVSRAVSAWSAPYAPRSGCPGSRRRRPSPCRSAGRSEQRASPSRARRSRRSGQLGGRERAGGTHWPQRLRPGVALVGAVVLHVERLHRGQTPSAANRGRSGPERLDVLDAVQPRRAGGRRPGRRRARHARRGRRRRG